MILFTSSQVGEVLQRLYNSEIDINMYTEFGAGYTFATKAHPSQMWRFVKKDAISDICEAVNAISFEAASQYPDSDFAKWYEYLHHPAESVVGRNSDGFLLYGGGLPCSVSAFAEATAKDCNYMMVSARNEQQLQSSPIDADKAGVEYQPID